MHLRNREYQSEQMNKNTNVNANFFKERANKKQQKKDKVIINEAGLRDNENENNEAVFHESTMRNIEALLKQNKILTKEIERLKTKNLEDLQKELDSFPGTNANDQNRNAPSFIPLLEKNELFRVFQGD